MEPACLEHCLTDEERRTFEETGLLVLPEALPPEMVSGLEEKLEAIYRERRAADLGPHDGMFHPNFVGRDPLFLELLDWPRVFPKVWGILGWNIYLYHGHCAVNPPADPALPRVKKTLGWHQDSGRVNLEMESHPRPRLSLKVAYFLSDCSEAGRGNFHVIPGSHLRDTLQRPEDGVSDPEGAVPVCVEPGTAVFFDRRLWHAGSPNWSDVTRKALFYGYGYRWIRPKDDMTIPPEWFAACSPVRQQLLGGGVNCNGHYSPTDADVPLRAWLREHCPQDAA